MYLWHTDSEKRSSGCQGSRSSGAHLSIVSIALLVVLIASVSAIIPHLSDSSAVNDSGSGSDFVCVYEKHGATYWESSLDTAIYNTNGEMITLLNDCTPIRTITIDENKKINLNLNGHSISGAGVLIEVRGELHIIDDSDGTIPGAVYRYEDAYDVHECIHVADTGTLTIDGGIFGGYYQAGSQSVHPTCKGNAISNTGGTVVLNGGHYTSG